MTIEQKIFSAWSGDATATALVPAAQFKPAGSWQNVPAPYVINFPVGEKPIRTIREGVTALRIYTWQFSVFAQSASQARTILNKLRSLFDGNLSGFNFQHQGERFVDESPDMTLVLYTSDFLVTTVE